MSQGAKTWTAFLGVLLMSAALVAFALQWGRHSAASAPGRLQQDGPESRVPRIVVDDGSNPASDPLRPDYRVLELKMLPFDLIDQSGKQITHEAFTGKITVVSFFFTRCTIICPAMTGVMLKLADKLQDTPAKFLSFSVDPDGDTPAALAQYAVDVGADTTRWTFATGRKDTIWNMLRQGLKWGIEARPEERIPLKTGGSMDNIRHPGWFALVGPDGRVLEIYDSSSEENQQALEARIRAVLKRMQ